jgi:hypothetical protein
LLAFTEAGRLTRRKLFIVTPLKSLEYFLTFSSKALNRLYAKSFDAPTLFIATKKAPGRQASASEFLKAHNTIPYRSALSTIFLFFSKQTRRFSALAAFGQSGVFARLSVAAMNGILRFSPRHARPFLFFCRAFFFQPPGFLT